MPVPENFKAKFKEQFKALFETPEKTRITISCLVVALAMAAAIVYVLCAPRNAPAAAPSSPPSQAVSDAPSDDPGEDNPLQSEPPGDPEQSQPPKGIVPTLTIDEARALALQDAGLTEDQVEMEREALEVDNGIWVFAFRFSTQQVRYEYKVNANTGEIRTMLREVFAFPSPEAAPSDPSVPPAPEVSEPMPSLPPESGEPESSEELPDASPQPAPSAEPDPTPSPEPSPAAQPTPPSSLYIGMSRAKSIALDHAGLSASQAVIARESMARENGRAVYVIEFRWSGARYQYKIDAQSGAVLEHSRR